MGALCCLFSSRNTYTTLLAVRLVQLRLAQHYSLCMIDKYPFRSHRSSIPRLWSSSSIVRTQSHETANVDYKDGLCGTVNFRHFPSVSVDGGVHSASHSARLFPIDC